MTFLSHLLAAGLALTGTSWCQTIRTAPIRVRTVPVSVQAVPVSPISGSSFQDRLSPSLASPAGSLAPVSIAPLSLPAPEITASAPSLSAAVPVVSPAGLSQTPAERTPEAGIGARIRQISEGVAGPLKTASDEKASPDQSSKAGRDIEEALTGESVVEAQEDLPPAGPVNPLDAKQVAWLQNELVTGPRPLLTDPGFRAFVLWDEKALGDVIPWLRNDRQGLTLALHAMINSLRRVAESELPAVERGQVAQSLNERFRGVVKALSQGDHLKPKQKHLLADVHDRFLANRAALFELTHYLQTVKSLRSLDGKVQSLLAPAPSPAPAQAQTGSPVKETPQKVEHPWHVKPPLPKDQRGKNADTEVSLVNKTADWAATVKEWQFLVEKHLARYQIAIRSGRFSRRIKEFAAQRLLSLLEDYKRKAGVLFTGVERIASYSLVNSFLNPDSITGRARGIVWVPDNKNLRLAAEKGGWVVKASFETDIQDDAVLKAVKSSIEEYWQGSFEFQKKIHTLRTEISIRKLAPGAAFSAGALTIRDNTQWLSLAGPDVILLGHDLHYATAAHEFGHTMGLADEYRNGYDPDLRASVELQNPGSIMSSLSGEVLPRHLKLAFLLLKRRSIQP